MSPECCNWPTTMPGCLFCALAKDSITLRAKRPRFVVTKLLKTLDGISHSRARRSAICSSSDADSLLDAVVQEIAFVPFHYVGQLM